MCACLFVYVRTATTNVYAFVIIGSWQELRGRYHKRSVVRITGDKFLKIRITENNDKEAEDTSFSRKLR